MKPLPFGFARLVFETPDEKESTIDIPLPEQGFTSLEDAELSARRHTAIHPQWRLKRASTVWEYEMTWN